MSATPSDEGENGQTTVAGCLLMLLSVAVIGGVAVPLVMWRDPQSGQPLPRMLSIALPVLAGAVCYGIGTGILKLFGLSVEVKPGGDSNEHP